MTGTFSAADVLEFLDGCLRDHPTWAFIDLEHPYVYTANSRLTLYANETTWALVSEVSGYNPAVQHFEHSAAPINLKVREQTVRVPAEVSTFVPKIGGGSWPKDAEFEDIGRYIAYEYADLCRATNAEKRMHLPSGLPELMTIDEWHHRRWYYSPQYGASGDAPSSYETYRLIADVLATRDPSRYKPKLNPNNHWSNWPAAGSL